MPITLNLAHLGDVGHKGWCVTGVFLGVVPTAGRPDGLDETGTRPRDGRFDRDDVRILRA
jgi:hypothetical protein